jgi:hypothetical protein
LAKILLIKFLLNLDIARVHCSVIFLKLVREKKIIKSNNTNEFNEFLFNDMLDEKHWIEQIKADMIAD